MFLGVAAFDGSGVLLVVVAFDGSGVSTRAFDIRRRNSEKMDIACSFFIHILPAVAVDAPDRNRYAHGRLD